MWTRTSWLCQYFFLVLHAQHFVVFLHLKIIIDQFEYDWAGGAMLPIRDKIATWGRENSTDNINIYSSSCIKDSKRIPKRLLKDKNSILTDASKTSTNISLHLLLPQNGFRNIQAALCFQELKLWYGCKECITIINIIWSYLDSMWLQHTSWFLRP